MHLLSCLSYPIVEGGAGAIFLGFVCAVSRAKGVGLTAFGCFFWGFNPETS